MSNKDVPEGEPPRVYGRLTITPSEREQFIRDGVDPKVLDTYFTPIPEPDTPVETRLDKPA